jgi:hypothetical protein
MLFSSVKYFVNGFFFLFVSCHAWNSYTILPEILVFGEKHHHLTTQGSKIIYTIIGFHIGAISARSFAAGPQTRSLYQMLQLSCKQKELPCM